MGCHTVLGNGAYLGPDLTNIYEQAGPAWLEAFLPSAGGWPTGPAVQVQLQKAEVQADAGTGNLDEYLKRYSGGNERVLRRGGQVRVLADVRRHQVGVPLLPAGGEAAGPLGQRGVARREGGRVVEEPAEMRRDGRDAG